jgi:very-short-patch-repair endonuclease
LHRVRCGVYQVGHSSPPSLAAEVSALLAFGPGSILSHRSAAVLWELLPSDGGPVDLTVIGRECGRRPGVRDRRARRLAPEALRQRDGLPVTAPARTLLDIAGAVRPQQLERAVNEAFVRRLTTMKELRATLGSSKGRPGTPALRRLLDELEGPSMTRSEAEERMRALLSRARLPSPETNVRVGPYEVDMLWRGERLVVEVDGYAFHGTRAAFERDRVRDAELQARGLRVLRVTWRQLSDEPQEIVGRIARMLG